MASSSSSSSCVNFPRKYDVFLSFREEDTGDNFTSHLFASLCRKKIRTFIDDEELRRGDAISSALSDAIEGSKISVVIFSKDYASSKWCLDELVTILECQKMKGQIAIPVFYNVDPSDVRKQTGSFGNAFVKHEKHLQEIIMPEKIQKWRTALTEASNLSGWDSMKIRSEAKLVDEIVKDILKKLKDKSLASDFEGLVGIHSRFEEIKSLLCIGLPDFRIVGIWGMGGIGKTTIAGVVFNQICTEFEGKCFMTNVREESERGGLVHLREQLLSQIVDENLKIGTPNLPRYIKERLQQMKVFIVFDDVNHFKQLEYLAGGLDRFGPGSRIIVTTRDKQVLDKYGVDNIYEVKGFNYHEALEIFCNYAFKQNHRPQDLLILSKNVVDYANGNPLALKVLGSSFFRKSKQDWENAVHNLKRILDHDIYDVLTISYDELSWKEKNLFLDIACFFRGGDKDYVKTIQDDDYSVQYGLSVLVDKSLITISNNKLQMHDLLQEMGQRIVFHESCKEPGKRSRLWYHEDVYHVLKKNKGTDLIEGIFLDMSKVGEIHLNSGAFANMSNLRLLKFYMPNPFNNWDTNSKVRLPQGLEYLSDELRYLHWHGYPLKTLPLNFRPENLIELNLPHSRVEQLWEGKKEAFKLRWIDLHNSRDLVRIPEPVQMPNLERINLLNCTKLPCIPSSIQNFNNLRRLCLKGCESLACFTSNIHFKSPIMVNFSFCLNLTKFPQISGNIKELYLLGTPIEEIPSSIECLTMLENLNLEDCTRLKSISTNICKLKSLHGLCLYNCSKLEIFPEILEKMECLKYVVLDLTAIKELPSSIERLEGLTNLSLRGCSKLDSLPENLGNVKSLESVYAEGSTISQLPSTIVDLSKLKEVWCSGCRGLVLPPLSGLSSLAKLHLTNCNITEIPQDIGRVISLQSLDLRGNHFESLPASIKLLSQLRSFYLSNCSMLQSLPELPLGLNYLIATDCKQLQSLPKLPSCLEELDATELEILSECCSQGFSLHGVDFEFTNCLKLNQQAGNNVLADSQLRIQHMATASLRQFYEEKSYTRPIISICLPGSGIPDWFIYQSSGSSVTIQHLLRHWCNRRFIGFALCVVIAFKEAFDIGRDYFAIKCSYNFETKTDLCENTKNVDGICYLAAATDYRVEDLIIDSDHVLLGFDSCLNIRLQPDVEHDTNASFDFSIYHPFPTQQTVCLVKCCGVCPVYANSKIYSEEEVEPNPKRICIEQINAPLLYSSEGTKNLKI